MISKSLQFFTCFLLLGNYTEGCNDHSKPRKPIMLEIEGGNRDIHGNEGKTISFKLKTFNAIGTKSYSCKLFCPGSLKIDADGKVTWEADYESAGTHSMTFQVRDQDNSGQIDVKIIVQERPQPNLIISPINHTPLALIESSHYILGTKLQGVDQPIKLSCIECPDGVSIKNQEISWDTPKASKKTTYYFKLGITSLEEDYQYGTYTLSPVVYPMNRLMLTIEGPEAGFTGKEGEALEFRLSTNRNSKVSYSCISNCPKDIKVSTSGQVSWTPDYRSAGTYEITFNAKDEHNSDQSTVQLNIDDSMPPKLTINSRNEPLSLVSGIEHHLNFELENIDDSLILTCIDCPPGMKIEENKLVWKAPSSSSKKVHRILIRASKSTGFRFDDYSFKLELEPSDLARMKKICLDTKDTTWRSDLMSCTCDSTTSDDIYHYIYFPESGRAVCATDPYGDMDISTCRQLAKFEDIQINHGIKRIQECLDKESIITRKNQLSLQLITENRNDSQLIDLMKSLDRRSDEDKKPILPNLPIWLNERRPSNTILSAGHKQNGGLIFTPLQTHKIYENDEISTDKNLLEEVRYLYEPNPSMIFEAFEKRTKDIAYLSSRPGFLGEVANIINDHYIDDVDGESPLRNQGEATRVTFVGSKVDSFYLSSPTRVYKGQGLRVMRRTFFMRDIPYRDMILFESTDGSNRVAKVFLSRTGMISMIAFYSENTNDLSYKIELLDRNWKRIGYIERQITQKNFGISANNLDELKKHLEEYQTSEQSQFPVAVCEGGYDVKHLTENLFLTGPNNRNSLFGWYDSTETLGLKAILAGFGGAFEFAPLQANNHGSSVVAALKDVFQEVKIAPLATTCYERDLWYASKQNLSNNNIKVINISNVYFFGLDYCRLFLGHLPNEKDFLFVLGAGNGGENQPINRCPQLLSGAENILVVTGLKYGSKPFDYGVDYADVMADTSTPISQRKGTSLAAPRVAAIATELFGMDMPQGQPNYMTPQIVRWIMIASSDYNQNHADKSRSGGFVNRESAKNLARLVNERTHRGHKITKDIVIDLTKELYGTNCSQNEKCRVQQNHLRSHL